MSTGEAEEWEVEVVQQVLEQKDNWRVCTCPEYAPDVQE